MPAGLKVGLVAGLAVAVGFVLWAVNQSGNSTKTDLPFDSSVKQGDTNTELAQDVAKSFSNQGPSARAPIAKIPPRQTPRTERETHRPRTERNTSTHSPESPVNSPRRSIPPGRIDRGPTVHEPGNVRPPERRESPPPETSPPSHEGADSATNGDNAAKPGPAPQRPESKPLEPKLGTPTLPSHSTEQPKKSTETNEVPKAPERRSTTPPVATPGQKVHTVVEGDTLIFIAGQNYLDENLWPAIKLANPGIDENKLKVGQKLIIPSESEAKRLLARGGSNASTPKKPAVEPPARSGSDPTSGSTAGRGSSGGDLTYTVESGDSLIKIARKVLGDEKRWPEIFELNKDKLASPDQIQVGMKLRMPKK